MYQQKVSDFVSDVTLLPAMNSEVLTYISTGPQLRYSERLLLLHVAFLRCDWMGQRGTAIDQHNGVLVRHQSS